MKRYTYKAKDKKTGKTVSGVVQAADERAAGRILIDQGYVPQRVREDVHEGFFAKLQNRVGTAVVEQSENDCRADG